MRRMKLLSALVLTGTALAVTGGSAAPALAAGNPVIQDCYSHGRLTKTYPPAELRKALHSMSSYVKQYTNCQTVIENQLQNPDHVKANGTGGDGGGGSSISTGLIVVIVVVVLAILAFGGLLWRRRRTLGDRGGDGP